MCVCMWVCVCMCACVCMRVCVWERECVIHSIGMWKHLAARYSTVKINNCTYRFYYYFNYCIIIKFKRCLITLPVYRGFPTNMVYLYYISCLRYTILVRNPWHTLALPQTRRVTTPDQSKHTHHGQDDNQRGDEADWWNPEPLCSVDHTGHTLYHHHHRYQPTQHLQKYHSLLLSYTYSLHTLSCTLLQLTHNDNSIAITATKYLEPMHCNSPNHPRAEPKSTVNNTASYTILTANATSVN